MKNSNFNNLDSVTRVACGILLRKESWRIFYNAQKNFRKGQRAKHIVSTKRNCKPTNHHPNQKSSFSVHQAYSDYTPNNFPRNSEFLNPESSIPLKRFLSIQAQHIQAAFCHARFKVDSDILRFLPSASSPPALALIISISMTAAEVGAANRFVKSGNWAVIGGEYPLGTKLDANWINECQIRNVRVALSGPELHFLSHEVLSLNLPFRNSFLLSSNFAAKFQPSSSSFHFSSVF
ncbi:hypothetical protein M9H77_16650 [Catharanthus roseus]|uniref:Uncharacterized protein n=1 Tax=Catharanthus roseus TaxID=4058 RepID=A0ACC0B2C4_CATRO|nr:hypothetical protein M9H77_16650 [Catharanthus roseus]